VNTALVRFILLLVAGCLGAAATGKLVPHAHWLTQTNGISLGMAGFAISAVMLPGAILSAGLGVLTDRFGARNVAVSGLALGAAASAALGYTSSIWALIALRLIEGAGYCLLVVAATVLVIETSTDQRRTLVLSVWSSFAPIGSWHAALMILAAIVIRLGIPARSPPGHPATARAPASIFDSVRHAPALRAALAFGCVTGVLLAAVAVTPLVLSRSHGIPIAEAARLAALASLPGIAGRFAAGWLLGWRLTPTSVLVSASLGGAMTIALVLVARLPLGATLALFTLFQILMGIIPGVLSAMIPHIAPARDRIGSVSGLINQMVTLGNLIGPPLILSVFAATDAAGAAATLAGWTALCVISVASLAVFRKPVL
jgi:MFS transporter, CP family, cyanate transporter